MTKEIEALSVKAYKYLTSYVSLSASEADELIVALRQQSPQPAKPVGVVMECTDVFGKVTFQVMLKTPYPPAGTRLFTSPQPAQELTDEMIDAGENLYYAPPDNCSDDEHGVRLLIGEIFKAMLASIPRQERWREMSDLIKRLEQPVGL